MTATRLPAKSTGSAGHRPVWCWTPRNSSRPGMSGMYGTDSTPVAVTRKRARSVGAVARSTTVQVPDGSSYDRRR